MRSFYFIWALTSSLPTSLLYLVYMKIGDKNIYTDLLFYGVEIAIIGSAYYFLVIQQARLFIETAIGLQYYNFGKFNIVLKTLVILFGFGLVVLISRLLFIVLQ